MFGTDIATSFFCPHILFFIFFYFLRILKLINKHDLLNTSCNEQLSSKIILKFSCTTFGCVSSLAATHVERKLLSIFSKCTTVLFSYFDNNFLLNEISCTLFFSVNKADDGTSNFLKNCFEYKRCLNKRFYFLIFMLSRENGR